MKRFDVSPWAGRGLRQAGVSMAELQDRVPDGWSFRGTADSHRGPFHFTLANSVASMKVTAARWDYVRGALDKLFASDAPGTLEAQLAASLAALR